MKQVIVVNAALGLPPGKLAAQVAHAAVGALLGAPAKDQRSWLEAGMAKIVLQCLTEAELLAVAGEAEAAGLPVFLVRDAGRTVVQAGTVTCLGIGPASPERIDAVTGGLSLVR
jgi:peptidyl-tRNA hydrolase